ncbi:ABC transporter ATP-binding protein [Sediminispirochaeta bajacaliforniensis]|uniref:ABC transporter ATP-binding protein n=1 Tax=Sediminispirochaeta bajacaliforniensis TaxID=148 RepID=UPI000366E2F4|nr:ABC transporter ATP-binding protein [Sediminispirochaeta bajacaliforniensis]
MEGVLLSNISKRFQVDGRTIDALKRVNLSVPKGAFVSIVGYSGCGKTTLLNVIMGLQHSDEGSLFFDGMDGRTAMVFQEPRLVAALSVEKNMALALKHEKDPARKEMILDHTLEVLGLTAFRKALPCQLSGGMAQRVALGRALCREPELLLMDEPFGALDALNRKRLQEELVRIYLDREITILFVTHDVAEAVLLGRKVCVMDQGEVRLEIPVPLPYPRNPGSAEFISLREKVLEAILREDGSVLPHQTTESRSV